MDHRRSEIKISEIAKREKLLLQDEVRVLLDYRRNAPSIIPLNFTFLAKFSKFNFLNRFGQQRNMNTSTIIIAKRDNLQHASHA